MNEQERPRTEAWKSAAWAAWLRAEHPGAASLIEAEGRQQAVREIEDVRVAARIEASYDAPRRPEYADGYRQAAFTIAGWLDRVAGLNASEATDD